MSHTDLLAKMEALLVKLAYDINSDADTNDLVTLTEAIAALRTQEATEPRKVWLWMNFVDGRPEYWAFDNPYPCVVGGGDPLTLGEPCGYALVKDSDAGRPDVSEGEVIAAIKRVQSTHCACKFSSGGVLSKSCEFHARLKEATIRQCAEILQNEVALCADDQKWDDSISQQEGDGTSFNKGVAASKAAILKLLGEKL